MRFETIRVVIGEPGREVRQSIRTALFDRGFRLIHEAESVQALSEFVKSGNADLIIGDIAMPDGSYCNLVRRFRHHEIGPSPFILVISLMENPTAEAVKKVFDSGTDDLIVKPFAPNQLIERVMTLARGRKPFVVTHDYIGPDRRRGPPRPGAAETPLIEVPNPLRAKANGEVDPIRLQQMIDAAAALINEQKMERHATQITYLLERIIPAYEMGGGPKLDTLLDQLLYAGEDLSRRLRGTRYAHVAELAMSLVGLTMRIRNGGMKADYKDYELLPKLCQAIDRAFSREANTAEVAKEISRTLGKVVAGTRQ
ncbi:MAG: response regulator [Alphaproteobacteria bacterium]